jgi:hypothetical protein
MKKGSQLHKSSILSASQTAKPIMEEKDIMRSPKVVLLSHCCPSIVMAYSSVIYLSNSSIIGISNNDQSIGMSLREVAYSRRRRTSMSLFVGEPNHLKGKKNKQKK